MCYSIILQDNLVQSCSLGCKCAIERFHVMSSPSRLRRKTENSRHFGIQQDRGFYGYFHEMSNTLMMLLICVEMDKIPLLHKLKQLCKCLPVSFLIDIAYTANNILYKLYTKMAVYSSIWNCDHMLKMLYKPLSDCDVYYLLGYYYQCGGNCDQDCSCIYCRQCSLTSGPTTNISSPTLLSNECVCA